MTDDDFGIDLEMIPGLSVGKHKVFGLGPELTVPVATGDKLIAFVNARFMWEWGARTKTEGTSFVITATFPIPSISIN